jgi:hypothetical protein
VICSNLFLWNVLIEMVYPISKVNEFESFIESGTKYFLNNSNLLLGMYIWCLLRVLYCDLVSCFCGKSLLVVWYVSIANFKHCSYFLNIASTFQSLPIRFWINRGFLLPLSNSIFRIRFYQISCNSKV